MDLKEIYQELTGVDIEEQKKFWNERGKGYYGEHLIFCELHKRIRGNCKILMNLNIPVGDNKTTEIDLIMIHETGIYVFEIKHYKGTIYGSDNNEIWTQYFRTTKNNVFKNPILQNEYHINAIKKLLINIPVKSVIVFTNYDCKIKVKNDNPNIDICKLDNIYETLENRFRLDTPKFTLKEIDDIFNKLTPYSRMKEKVIIDGIEKDFISWIQPTINELQISKTELEKEKNNYTNNTHKLKKSKTIGYIIIIIVSIICILFTIFSINKIKYNYNLELNKFKQNFIHVDEIGNKYIDKLNDFVNVSNVSITELSDNIISFTARLNMNNDIYGMAINKDSKYIVISKTGKV